LKVYQAINAVQAALSVDGIGKTRRNTQGSGYNFRGIDDVYNALSPLLAQHGLVIIPRMLARTCEERQSKAGGALFYVTVEAEFDFVAAEDGSKATARTFGEAMDSGDKATNKAMSAAYKYAAFQTFAIPTEGNPDADAETHEVVRGMLPSRIADWCNAIGQAAPDEVDALIKDGLLAAEECKDRDAYAAIRKAGRDRTAQLAQAT
jgi:ERF superfamily